MGSRTQLIASFLVVVAIIFGVLLVSRYPFKQQNTDTATDAADNNVLSEQERAILTAATDRLKQALSEKNGWNPNQYDLVPVYYDPEYAILQVHSFIAAIPDGTILARHQNDTYELLFDSSTTDPCSQLDANSHYPYTIATMCGFPL